MVVGARAAVTHDRYLHNIIVKTMLLRYAASVAAPYLWDFIRLYLNRWILEVRDMLLSEELPPWLGILAKLSLVSECVERACVRWKLHVFAINLQFLSPYLYSWIPPWWNERKLDLLCAIEERIRALTWFDSLPFHLTRILHFSSFLLHSWDIARKGGHEDKESQSYGVSQQRKEHLHANATSMLVICLFASLNSHHWACEEHYWFQFKCNFIQNNLNKKWTDSENQSL